MQPKYAFIGDVHSQAEPLLKALVYCEARGITPILLGDVFNSKELRSDSAEVYRLLRMSERCHGAVVLQSNHQSMLLDALSSDPSSGASARKEIVRTVSDLREAGIDLQEVQEWLSSLPYALSFLDSRGTEYRAAHAEIPPSIHFPSATENLYQVHEVSPEERVLLLWGKPYNLPNSERFWWLRKCRNPWVTVAGHYHKVVVKEGFVVLDAGCGERTRSWDDCRESALPLFDIEESKLVYFPTQGGKTFEERIMA